jgi:hypothetical protein
MNYSFMEPVPEVGRLLKARSAGDRSALDRLTPIVYKELRRLARNRMRGERGGDHTFQTTALVNEAVAPSCGIGTRRLP